MNSKSAEEETKKTKSWSQQKKNDDRFEGETKKMKTKLQLGSQQFELPASSTSFKSGTKGDIERLAGEAYDPAVSILSPGTLKQHLKLNTPQQGGG